MPVFNPQSFVFNVATTKKNAAGEAIPVVAANGTDKYEVSLAAVNWDGSTFNADVPITVYFSDGRPLVTAIVAKDVPFILPVTSTVARLIDLTINATGTDYYRIVKNLQFSAAA